jgi:3-methyladenine DNA glycosylase/8-oxoguanine DNA glycosylase
MPTSISLRVARRAAGMAITRSKRSSPSISEAAVNNSAGTRAKKSKMVKRELKVEIETNGNDKITVSEAVIDSFKASTKGGKAKTVKKEVKIELETSEEVKSDVVESKAMDYISEFRKGLKHVLYIDPSLKKIVESSNFLPFSIARIKEEESMTCFEYLASGIIGQQVSGAAAKSIERKFRLLFYKGDKQPEDVTNGEVAFPTAQQVLEKSIEQLRFAGLSARKAEYISGLAEAFSSGKLSDVILKSANDDDIVDMLVALKGIGRTYMQFSLSRKRRFLCKS